MCADTFDNPNKGRSWLKLLINERLSTKDTTQCTQEQQSNQIGCENINSNPQTLSQHMESDPQTWKKYTSIHKHIHDRTSSCKHADKSADVYTDAAGWWG